MRNITHQTSLSGGVFNTLAQSGTTSNGKPPLLVLGKGSDLNEKKGMKGRAKRKLITQKMVLSLIDVAKANGEDEFVQTCWRTWRCGNKLTRSGNKVFMKYCKNRFCTVCLSIRKALMINLYHPTLFKWKEPYFVTLTVKAQPYKNLKKWIGEGMLRGFRRITSRNRKRAQRGKGIKLVGIRSLESNFNPIKRTYNPHFHVIVQSRQMAELLLAEWLDLWTSKHANKQAQKMTPIRNKEIAMKELIKYGSKIFTEPDISKKSKLKKNDRTIYVAALHKIFLAMKDHRLFDRFGFDLPDASKIKKGATVNIFQEYDRWQFDVKTADWKNEETGERLTGYIPPQEMIDLLENHIDAALY